MAVKAVKKIKTTYKAVQWNGEESEADEIRELMSLNNVNGYFYNDSGYSYGPYAYVHLYDKRGDDREGEALNVGDWVVVSSKGKIEVLRHHEYEERYEDA